MRAYEMLRFGFKVQIYDIYRHLPPGIAPVIVGSHYVHGRVTLEASKYDLNYIGLDGTIGLMVNGGKS
jgi:succinyl-CoA synthetase beta subunit